MFPDSNGELRILRELCHDLSVPAASIKLLAQAAAAESDPGPSVRARLRQIASEAGRITDICGHVLEQPIADNTADLHVLAADVAGSARSRYAGVIELSADAVTAAAHPVAATRILSNIVDNACRAAGPGGRVRLAVRRDGDQATVIVTDSGPGFGHAPSGKASLGLTIVATMVRRSGGTVRMGGSDCGGTAVTVTLPAALPQGLVPGRGTG